MGLGLQGVGVIAPVLGLLSSLQENQAQVEECRKKILKKNGANICKQAGCAEADVNNVT